MKKGPFTWANRSIHGLGKWYAKFRAGKFRHGIAFTICTNQFHLPKNDREGLDPVSKMELEYSVRKKRTTFSDLGVDKTRNREHSRTFRNMPEHSGTSRNISKHEKIKIIFMKIKKINNNNNNNKIIFIKINNKVK